MQNTNKAVLAQPAILADAVAEGLQFERFNAYFSGCGGELIRGGDHAYDVAVPAAGKHRTGRFKLCMGGCRAGLRRRGPVCGTGRQCPHCHKKPSRADTAESQHDEGEASNPFAAFRRVPSKSITRVCRAAGGAVAPRGNHSRSLAHLAHAPGRGARDNAAEHGPTLPRPHAPGPRHQRRGFPPGTNFV